MPALEKVCEAWQHDMTTCQDLPFRYNVRVPYVVREKDNSMADSPENGKNFRGVLMRISSKMGTSPPSSRSDRVLQNRVSDQCGIGCIMVQLTSIIAGSIQQSP
jgi:hypothetical protein